MIRIEPRRGLGVDLGEVWRSRELLWFLTWRDVKVRYQQAVLGVGWVVVQPLATMAVFTIFFGRLIGVPSDDIPYPVFAFTGLVVWGLFANGVTRASSSLVAAAGVITKVYFPRILVPAAAVLAAAVDFAVALGVLVVLMLVVGVTPGAAVVWLPAFALLALVTSLAASLWLSALNVRYRDVQAAVPFVVQFWFFATPVVYPSSLLTGRWRDLFGLNPMVGVVDGFRWALVDGPPPDGVSLAASAGVALLALAGGVVVFRRLERSFADHV